jgi:phage N-6-adenine-methyltransferase
MSDSWQTPQWLFDELNEEFNFDLDLCCTQENTKCPPFCIGDYLTFDVKQFKDLNACFMNPPYSNPQPFIEKAWEDSKHCKIVCLVKCDPSTKWWGVFWDYGTTRYCTRCHRVCEVFDKEHEEDAVFSKCCIDWATRPSGPKPGCEVRFFPKRIKFEAPNVIIAKKKSNSGPTFASALIIMDRRGL